MCNRYGDNLREERFVVNISPGEDGMFVAECVSLPGCISQGKTEKEALENIKDAIKGYLKSLAKHGEKRPPSHSLLHLADN